MSVVVIGPDGVGFEDVSENKHWDFHDISGLMQTAITNYRRSLGSF